MEKRNNLSNGGKGDRVATSSLPHYRCFDELFGLYGGSYSPAKKVAYYNLIGEMIKESQIRVGNKLFDTRIPVAIPLKSGHGKLAFKSVIKRSVEGVEHSFVCPDSLHSEQLVGKSLDKKKEGPIKNYGHLYDDYVLVDEAVELLVSPSHEESRRYINVALDPIGFNEITKRSVETIKGDEIKYCPKCSMTLIFQPVPIRQDVVTRGTLRRFLIPYNQIPEDERDTAIDNVLWSLESNTKAWDEWINFLRLLHNREYDWSFPDETKQSLSKLTKQLIAYGRGRGCVSRAYTSIMHFQLLDFLIKMSVVQAAANARDQVNSKDVENAYQDLMSTWILQLDFISQNIIGRIDYQNSLTTNEVLCLNVLEDENCYSKDESRLNIGEFDEIAAGKINKTKGSIRKTYRPALKDKGFIDYQQVGRHDSRIWLTKKGIAYYHPTTLDILDENEGK